MGVDVSRRKGRVQEAGKESTRTRSRMGSFAEEVEKESQDAGEGKAAERESWSVGARRKHHQTETKGRGRRERERRERERGRGDEGIRQGTERREDGLAAAVEHVRIDSAAFGVDSSEHRQLGAGGSWLRS
eukprot:4506208-Pleurochrysis_carterae.AAC.1